MEHKSYRFRVFDADRHLGLYRSDSLHEIYLFLKRTEVDIDDMFVDCTIDDINVSAEDIVMAFDAGEHPEDLQFF